MARLNLLTLSVGLSLCLASQAGAQSGTRTAAGGGIANFQSIGSSVSSGATSSRSSFAGLGIGGGGAPTKPFSGFRTSPSVSPYINLFNVTEGGATSFDNYNTLVRPQLNQQAINQATNQRLRQQQTLINQRVQAISAQNAIPTQGSENIFPTGHSTAFGFYSRYYPSLGRRR